MKIAFLKLTLLPLFFLFIFFAPLANAGSRQPCKPEECSSDLVAGHIKNYIKYKQSKKDERFETFSVIDLPLEGGGAEREYIVRYDARNPSARAVASSIERIINKWLKNLLSISLVEDAHIDLTIE